MADDQALQGQSSHLANGGRGRSQLLPYQPHGFTGPKILSSTGAGVWRKAPMAFPDSSSVLDKFQSANMGPPRFCNFSVIWGVLSFKVLRHLL